jgi:hypothetical protein
MPTLEQTVYDIAIRALSQQEQTLNELRARTGVLLTASALIASFLGAQTVARSGFSVWVIFALTAFSVSIGLSVYALLPKRGLIFALNAAEVYTALVDLRDDEAAWQRQIAYWLQTFRQGNHATVRRVTRVFEVAALALFGRDWVSGPRVVGKLSVDVF